MSTAETRRGKEEEARHRQVALLLPWYANDTLEAAERARVEEHLAGCPRCREEAAACRELARALGEAEAPALSPHPVQLSRLMARVEAEEGRRLGRRLAAFARHLGDLFQAAPPLARWALAVQLALVLGLGAALFALRGQGPEAGTAGPGEGPAPYRTLAAPAAPAAAPGPSFRVLFAEALSEGELRRLLLELGAEITAGPSPLGAYTLTLGEDSSSDSSSVILAHLRSHPGVRFAEPVPPAGEEGGAP